MALLEQSYQTLHVACYQGKRSLEIVKVGLIRLVVGMVPFMLSAAEENCPESCAHYSNCFFVAKNPTMLFSSIEAQASDCEEQDDTEECDEGDESDENEEESEEGEESDENEDIDT
jgi:hypothetical protein